VNFAALVMPILVPVSILTPECQYRYQSVNIGTRVSILVPECQYWYQSVNIGTRVSNFHNWFCWIRLI